MAKALEPTVPDLDAAFTEAAAGRRVKVRRGRKTVAVVPVRDLEFLRRAEDLLDIEQAREALAEAREQGTKSLADFRAELGLEAGTFSRRPVVRPTGLKAYGAPL